MAAGMDYDRALDKADDAEKAERGKTELARLASALAATGQVEILNRVRKQLLEEYGTRIRVWIVDGELVRDLYFIDFTEGGHDKVYKFIPKNEIWLDDDVMDEERKFILLHELHERYLMGLGWSYSKAHKDSSRIEYRCRQQTEGLDPALKEEIRKNTGNADAPPAQDP